MRLDDLPACRVFWLERELARFGARYAMLEGRNDDPSEMAFVLRTDDHGTWPEPEDTSRERGFATMAANGTVVVEWATTPRAAAAAFSRALARVDWAGSIHASSVYGSAS